MGMGADSTIKDFLIAESYGRMKIK